MLFRSPRKAKKQLGWTPKYDLEMLIKEMVLADLEHYKLSSEK